jgi:hypothetical protein
METSYSQNSEDQIIKEILDKIEIQDEEKWSVEFGAWDGVFGSNSNYFITKEGYKSVLIEGNNEKYQNLVKNMKDFDVVSLNKYVSFTGDNTLDNILNQTDIPKEFAFASIDIDGNDYYIWESFTQYRPKLVIIEFNPSISNEVEFIQPKDMNINQGCSPLSLVKLAKSKGYELVKTNLNNCFFVDKKYFSQFNIEDNSLYKLRTDLSHVTYIFNGYDGHVFVRGYKQLDLYSLPYNEKRMQLMPSFLQEWSTSSKLKRTLQRLHRSLKKRNLL